MTTTKTRPEHDGPGRDRSIPPPGPTELGQADRPAHRPPRRATAPSSAEAYDLLRSSGYLALAVPTELGGRGATIREVAMANRALARHCASTALASAMHHHVVLFTAWRYRRGLPGAEATLQRVADEGIVLVSTGGADLTRPRGQAVPTEGGYLGERPEDLRQPVPGRRP